MVQASPKKRLAFSLRHLFFITLAIALLVALSLHLSRNLRECLAIESEFSKAGALYASVHRENRKVTAVFDRLPVVKPNYSPGFARLEFRDITLDEDSLSPLQEAVSVETIVFTRCSFPSANCLTSIQDLYLDYLVFWECAPNESMLNTLGSMPNVRQISFWNSKLSESTIGKLRAISTNAKIVVVQGGKKVLEVGSNP